MPRLTEEERKERRRSTQKRYRAKHAQQIHADARKRRQEHPEASRLKNIRYRQRHPEQDRASKQKYLEKNPTYHRKLLASARGSLGDSSPEEETLPEASAEFVPVVLVLGN